MSTNSYSSATSAAWKIFKTASIISGPIPSPFATAIFICDKVNYSDELPPPIFDYFYEQITWMISKISEGIEVSVETFYQPDYSNPVSGEYMFAYRITIENHNSFSVKLHRRHWYIIDSNGTNREVEGEGVVGVQP